MDRCDKMRIYAQGLGIESNAQEAWIAWYMGRKERDFLIQMPEEAERFTTALLILQSCLEEKCGPAVCLASKAQIRRLTQRAEELKISVTRETADPAFLEGRSVMLLTPRELVFGMNAHGKRMHFDAFFQSIVVADSDRCGNEIRELMTIQRIRGSKGYTRLVHLFMDDIREQSEYKFRSILSGDSADELMLIPFWKWQQRHDQILPILEYEKYMDAEVEAGIMMTGDILNQCRCYVNSQKIEIRPNCVPIHSLKNYEQASRRIIIGSGKWDFCMWPIVWDADEKNAALYRVTEADKQHEKGENNGFVENKPGTERAGSIEKSIFWPSMEDMAVRYERGIFECDISELNERKKQNRELLVAGRKAFELCSRGDYQQASCILENAAYGLKDDKMKGYALQQSAEYRNIYDEVGARQLMKEAKKLNPALLITGEEKFSFSKLVENSGQQADNLLLYLKGHALDLSGEAYLQYLRKWLRHLELLESEQEVFEEAMQNVWSLIGVRAYRPQHRTGQGADVVCAAGKKTILVMECRPRESGVVVLKGDNSRLNSVYEWAKQQNEQEEWQIVPILVHRSNIFEKGCTPVPSARIMTRPLLRNWKAQILAFAEAFAGEGCFMRKECAQELLSRFQLDYSVFVETYTSGCSILR